MLFQFSKIIIITLVTISLGACVGARKYESIVNESELLKTKTDLQADSLKSLLIANESFKEKNTKLNQSNDLLGDELSSLKRQYKQLDKANEDLLKRYDRIIQQNQNEIAASSTALEQLRIDLSKKELQLSQKETELNALSKTLQEKENQLNSRIASLSADLNTKKEVIAASENEIDQQRMEVNQLKAALAEKDAKLNSLLNNMRAALIGFDENDLSVEEKQGQVYLSLSQNLLFASGSKVLNTKGKSALAKVAQALKQQEEINITVEGHTDTDGSAALNWNLSTARATTVAQTLIEGGIAPQQVTAAGRGQYHPVGDNSTAAGKALNRRTEIILIPN